MDIPIPEKPEEIADTTEDNSKAEETDKSISIEAILEPSFKSPKEVTATVIDTADPEELDGIAVGVQLEDTEGVSGVTSEEESENRTVNSEEEELEVDNNAKDVIENLRETVWRVCLLSFVVPQLATATKSDATNRTELTATSVINLHMVLHSTEIARLLATLTTIFRTWTTHSEQKQWRIAWYD